MFECAFIEISGGRESMKPMKQRLNLAHIVFDLGSDGTTGGMENGVINLCNRLPQDEFNPFICTFGSGGCMESRLDHEHIELIHVRKRFGNDPTLPFRLARQLRRRRIDILHTHNWGTLIEGLVAAKLAGVPVVIHGEHGKVRSRRRQIFAQRWAWRRVNQTLAVSSALADRVTRIVGFPREQIHVIPNGVDSERFQPSNAPKSEVRQKLDLPRDVFLIGMVARFVPFKNHAGVFHAIAQLRQENIDVHLALGGDGPLKQELVTLANELQIADRVHFLGVLDLVETMLHGLDVLVSNSSHNEGMSNAILEAMACGVPVVATRVAASPELLDEGNTGLLIIPQDTNALVAALRRLIDRPELRVSYSLLGRQRVEEHYSLASMVESYRRLYLRLAGVAKVRSAVANTAVKIEPDSKCIVN